MSKETWLYIYEGAPRSYEEERRSVYIGIGQSMGRVFEPHTRRLSHGAGSDL